MQAIGARRDWGACAPGTSSEQFPSLRGASTRGGPSPKARELEAGAKETAVVSTAMSASGADADAAQKAPRAECV